MKFTPESLIEIYMNGSFTEEAQAEFDKLMRRDPSFAEAVTHAVAERLGPPPEALVEQISGRLDSNIQKIWQTHKPSVLKQRVKKFIAASVLVAAAGGLYGGYQHFWGHSQPGEDSVSSSRSDGGVAEREKAMGGKLSAGKNNSSQTRQKSTGQEDSSSEGEVSTMDVSGQSSSKSTTGLVVAPSLAKPSLGNSKTGTSPAAPRTEEGDALRVSIETPKTQKVVVTVLDSNGILVRHLYQGIWNAGIHLVDWDGKDEIGNQVLPGSYTVVVNADGKSLSGQVTVKPNR